MATGGNGRMSDGLARDGRLVFYAIAILLLAAFLGVLIDPVSDKRQFTAFLFVRQDAPFAIVIALLARFGLANRIGRDDVAGRAAPHWWLIPLVLLLLCWIGYRQVFQAYAFTRDEQMGLFDAFIYGHGRITWPIAPVWRDHALALNQQFILPITGHQAWQSDYLPGNATMRALIALLVDPGWTNPLLTAIGAVALWRVARRLWPDDPGAQVTTLLLYSGSSQVVVMGMSGYAMAGYLTLNLIWLALFLRGGAAGHGGAILIGMVATGWHQPIFHPLFVLPFLAMLTWQRRWPLLMLYCVAYGGFGLAWLAWPHVVTALAGGAPPDIGTVGYGGRILMLLSDFSPVNLWLMAMNLLRFIAWQHLLLAPLALAGLRLARHEPMVLALTAGLALPMLAASILLAYQGHGWGYRYLHGVIGNACLLGGWGWRALNRHNALPRIANALHLASLLIALPIHAAVAAGLVAPYAAASRAIDAMDTDVAIIDDLAVAFGGDLVFNRPDLGNRPLRLMASQMDDAAMRDICRRTRTVFIGRTQLAPVRRAIPIEDRNTAHFKHLRDICAKVSRAEPVAPAQRPQDASARS